MVGHPSSLTATPGLLTDPTTSLASLLGFGVGSPPGVVTIPPPIRTSVTWSSKNPGTTPNQGDTPPQPDTDTEQSSNQEQVPTDTFQIDLPTLQANIAQQVESLVQQKLSSIAVQQDQSDENIVNSPVPPDQPNYTTIAPFVEGIVKNSMDSMLVQQN